MKVILTQDVKNLGQKGSIIEVKDGYARNYLLPKGLAEEATESNLNIIKGQKEAEKIKKEKELEKARSMAKIVNNTVVEIKAKAGENGKLFGSITSMDIAENLRKNFNLDIDKKKINLTEPIKSLGAYEAEVKLYPGVSAVLKIKILPAD